MTGHGDRGFNRASAGHWRVKAQAREFGVSVGSNKLLATCYLLLALVWVRFPRAPWGISAAPRMKSHGGNANNGHAFDVPANGDTPQAPTKVTH